MKLWWVVGGLGLLAGCASQETKVSCEGHLQPINVPAATADSPQKPAPAAAATTPATKGAS